MRTLIRHKFLWLSILMMLVSSSAWSNNDTISLDYKLCPDVSIELNGYTYSDPGIYYQHDTTETDTTLYVITITKYDKIIHITNATFNGTTPYTWSYTANGQLYTRQYTNPGTYEVYHPNNQTGCTETYRLILTLEEAPATSNVYTTNASICAGDSYTWRGKECKADGQYRDSVPQGASLPDSIFILNLQVWPYIDTTVVRFFACESGTIQYKGQTYTTDTTIVTHEHSIHGCDSIVKAFLSFNTSSFTTDTVYKKTSEFPFVWHNLTIRSAGTYTYSEPKEGECFDRYELVVYKEPIHTTIDLEGCLPAGVRFQNTIYYTDTTFEYQLFNDTIFTVNIRVCEGEQIVITDTVCEQELPYLLGEFAIDSIWAEGYYTHKEKISCGCYKSWELNLRIRPSFQRPKDSLIVCERDIKKEPVVLGDTANSSFNGHYKGIFISHDSVVTDCHGNTFHVIVRPTDDQQWRKTIDCGDSILWNGKWEYYSGIYDSTFYASGIADGQCLSTHRLYLSVIKHLQVTIYENEYYRFGNNPDGSERYLNQNGFYYDTIHNNTTDCDSIVALELYVLPTISIQIYLSESICQGDYYDFFGKALSSDGTYTHVSNDTVYTLTLSIRPVSLTKEYVLITAEQLPYPYHGYFCYDAGVYIDTLKNTYMCDSIIHMNLVVTDKLSAWDYIPLCTGESIVIEGQTISQAGEYYFNHRSSSGDLDSLYRVLVYDAPAYDLPTVHTTLYNGDTLRLADTLITTAGHYDIYRKTLLGCDSIVHADVSTHSILYDTICAGNEYTWRGDVYTETGVYSDTIQPIEGNYLAIYTLALKTLDTLQVDSVFVPAVSAEEKQIRIELSFAGERPLSYSLFFDKAALRAGFQDIHDQQLGTTNTIEVPVPQFSDTLYLDHTQYVRPDRYTMHIVLDNGRCGTVTTDTFSVLVKYPAWIIEQNWNNVVAPLSYEHNGGYRFSLIQWYVNDVPAPANSQVTPVTANSQQPIANSQYLYHPTLITGDEVYMIATREGENYGIPSQPIKIKNTPSEENQKPIVIYPNAVSHHMPQVTIETAQRGSYCIFNATGLMIQSGAFTDGQTKIQLPALSGIYFIHTRQNNRSQTHTILIY